ncbi:MAG TPA: sodium:proton antiporter NhaD [Kofleriaceae bacterium]|nr:sodium:proton antiporter NhaD [Kofleriaceae bacterium]
MWIVAIFALGYIAIVLEHPLKLNKAAAALLAGCLCWTAYVLAHGSAELVNEQLLEHLANLSQILFFLLGAMTIVELIDAHDGFELITSRIVTRSRRKLLVIIGLLTFFLSAILDNLTTAIVMMSLVRKLVPDDRDRQFYGGVVIIAANSGGAWSPIGDVTTTMLWMGHQITTAHLMTRIVVPAIVSVLIPMLWISFRLKGSIGRSSTPALAPLAPSTVTLPPDAAVIGKSLVELRLSARTDVAVVSCTTESGVDEPVDPMRPLRAGDTLTLRGSAEAIAQAVAFLVAGRAPEASRPWERSLVFFAGTGALVFVPIFKAVTHLPPFLGILLGLGVLWAITEVIHKGKNDESKGHLSVAGALQRVDSQSILFFLGILLAIAALESDGKLAALAQGMERHIGNVDLITMSIGLSSSVIDNVPLVAAAQGMYPLAMFATDHHFWLFLAYCAGTGGSILIIGSAAGIAVMGIQQITFGWYVRNMSLPALLGYLGGALVYIALAQF